MLELILLWQFLTSFFFCPNFRSPPQVYSNPVWEASHRHAPQFHYRFQLEDFLSKCSISLELLSQKLTKNRGPGFIPPIE